MGKYYTNALTILPWQLSINISKSLSSRWRWKVKAGRSFWKTAASATMYLVDWLVCQCLFPWKRQLHERNRICSQMAPESRAWKRRDHGVGLYHGSSAFRTCETCSAFRSCHDLPKVSVMVEWLVSTQSYSV